MQNNTKFGVMTSPFDRKVIWGLRAQVFDLIVDHKDTDIIDVTIFDTRESAHAFYTECVVYRGLTASKVRVGYEL